MLPTAFTTLLVRVPDCPITASDEKVRGGRDAGHVVHVTLSALIPADKNGFSFFSFGHFLKSFQISNSHIIIIIIKQEGNMFSLFTTGLIVWSCPVLISTAAVNGSLRYVDFNCKMLSLQHEVFPGFHCTSKVRRLLEQ